MDTTTQWVLLAYWLPREQSTPRITLWRKLKRLGAAQVLDSLVGLPATPRTREQFEWMAQEVSEAGGEASVWLASPLSVTEARDLTGRLTSSVADEYRELAASVAAAQAELTGTRSRTLGRLRREFRRITERDYSSPPERDAARSALKALTAQRELQV